MKNAYAEYQTLHRAWKAMRDARKSESSFDTYGLKGATAEDFDVLFEEWDRALSSAASKTKQAGADEKALEAMIVHTIGQLIAFVSPGVSNGFHWLIQSTAFVAKLGELNVALTPLIDSRFKVRKAVIEAAKSDLIGDITKVENAAPLADAIAARQASILEQAVEIEEALTSAAASKEMAQKDAELAALQLKAIDELATRANEAKSGYDENVAEIGRLLEAAQKKLDAVSKTGKAADDAIVVGTETLAAATQRLDKAIADVNRQGLAGAFQNSAERMGLERKWWLVGFFVALIYIALALAGVVGRWIGIEPPAGQEYWVRFLYLIPLASPGIWFGWFAARSAGLSARIQQDYAYKVATAQAFEAHKKEVHSPESGDLMARLLDVTIRNFGDNPIRLYEGKGLEGHPVEGLKSLFADDKQFEKAVRLLEALRPSAK